MSLTPTESSEVFVLDGGFSSQIAGHVGSVPDGDPLWTARFLQTHPDEIVNTHLDFLRAGSDIISTNTYQASIPGFIKHLKTTKEHAYNLIRLAVDLAKTAVKKYNDECLTQGLPLRKPLIAGSVGPYGAHLNDGSEYTGDYADKTAAEIIYAWHKPRIQTLVDSGVDILALETVPCQEEALVLANMIKEYPTVKAWISFSVKDEIRLAHGEDIKTVARKCWESNPDQIVALGANCCSPKIIANMIKNINSEGMPSIPIVTYPNSGEKYIREKGWVDDQCPPLHTFVNDWLNLNVRYVGGCCRTRAEDIGDIKRQVQKWMAR